MYFIYLINNIVNGKVYIGSSTESRGFYQRWKDHIKNSKYKEGYSYNYPLYKAMRKYGIENFIYEVIEYDIPTIELREEREAYYINYYNSLYENYGYNQTLDTRCPLADKRIKEKIATKLYAINIDTLEEEYFNSVCDAARICNVERRSIYHCLSGSNKYWCVGKRIFRRFVDGDIIECNVTIQDRLNEYNRTNPVINGERHNINDWCSIFGISRRTYYNRINEGMSTIEALTTKKYMKGNEKYV